MEASDIFKGLSGFLWEAICKIKADEYIKPTKPINCIDTILGPMTELEKALFSIRTSLFFSLLLFFDTENDEDFELEDFYDFVVKSSQVEFLEKCYKNYSDEKKLLTDEDVVLVLRANFLAAYDLLEIITSQRFDFFPENAFISYREGGIVTITDANLLIPSNN